MRNYTFLQLLVCFSCFWWVGCFSDKNKSKHIAYVASADSVALKQKHSLSLIFCGDYMQHIPQVKSARRADGSFDYHPVFSYIKPFFEAADFSVMNLETTLAPSGYSGFPQFRSPAECVTHMHQAGVNVLVMANNHCCDNGRVGIDYTLGVVDSCGFLRTGLYSGPAEYRRLNPLILSEGGLSVALLNYSYSTNGLPVPDSAIVNRIDTMLIRREIASVRSLGVREIIVMYHWGEEYRSLPGNYQKKLAEWTHRQGVSVVVGSHPHVVQPFRVEQSDSSCYITLFSLGNFISNQPEYLSKGGLSFLLEFTGTDNDDMRITGAEYMLHWVDSRWQNGRRNFQILPSFVADTLLVNEAGYKDYVSFRDETRRLIGTPPGIKERIRY